MAGGAWKGSTRRDRLPPHWRRLRERVRRRAGGRCEGPTSAATGQREGDTARCVHEGNECDHIVPGDDHREVNLQWLCGRCHAEKTKRETSEGLKRHLAKRFRKKGKHPGLID